MTEVLGYIMIAVDSHDEEMACQGVDLMTDQMTDQMMD